MPKRRFNPHKFFFQVKLYAVESAATIVFIWWLIRIVRHELQ